MPFDIVEIADLGPVCPSCGASSIAFRPRLGTAFSPIIGVCYGLAHTWHIEGGSLAWENWMMKRKTIEAGEVST